MSLSISQMLGISYSAVLNEKRKPANQWADKTFLDELEKQGFIKKVNFGPTLEHTIDYQRNPNAEFQASDLSPISLSKTEVLSALSYTEGQIISPITWSMADEIKNPSENQKVALVKSLMENAIDTHDDLLEEALFTTSTNGFLGLKTLVPDDGQGTVGGVSAAAEVWHRNPFDDYASNGTDLQAAMTGVWNAAAKGSGGSVPSLLVSDGDTNALYESTLTTNQRFVDVKEASGGFRALAFKTARYIFSQHGTANIYMLTPKCFRLNVAKNAFRDLSDLIVLPNQNGFTRRIYTMAQATVAIKSKLGVVIPA